MNDNYIIRHVNDVQTVKCPCGDSSRVITGSDNEVASIHVVNISKDSKVHYHKKLTEFYYVLDGSGQIELDGNIAELSTGTIVMIKPGVKHRARGNLKILNIVVPPFDEEDEFVAEES